MGADMAGYEVGDKVRLIQVPPYLYTDNPIDQETAEFIGRCVGKVFRVEDFDENGQLELWVTEKGNQRRACDRQLTRHLDGAGVRGAVPTGGAGCLTNRPTPCPAPLSPDYVHWT